MVESMEYQAFDPGSNPSVHGHLPFFFHFSQKYSKFCSAGRIACVSTHPVTDE